MVSLWSVWCRLQDWEVFGSAGGIASRVTFLTLRRGDNQKIEPCSRSCHNFMFIQLEPHLRDGL